MNAMNCAKCGRGGIEGDEQRTDEGEEWCQDCYFDVFHHCDNCGEETLLTDVTMVKTKSTQFADGILNTCPDCVEKVKAEYGAA